MVGGDTPSMPSHWMGVNIMVGNKDGDIPIQEEATPILHFCSRKCFHDYVISEDFVERTLLADQEFPENDEEDDDDNE